MLSEKTIKQVRKSFRTGIPEWMIELAESKGIPDFDLAEIDSAKSLDDAARCAVIQTMQLRDWLRRSLPQARESLRRDRSVISDYEVCIQLSIGQWNASIFPFIDELQNEANRIAGTHPGMAVELTRLKYEHDNNLRFTNSRECDGYESLENIIIYIRTLAEILERYGDGWPPKRGRGREWLDDAVAIKMAEPEITGKALAARLGIHPSTLCKSEEWPTVCRKIEENARASRRG